MGETNAVVYLLCMRKHSLTHTHRMIYTLLIYFKNMEHHPAGKTTKRMQALEVCGWLVHREGCGKPPIVLTLPPLVPPLLASLPCNAIVIIQYM